jgi:hypothetical protein
VIDHFLKFEVMIGLGLLPLIITFILIGTAPPISGQVTSVDLQSQVPGKLQDPYISYDKRPFCGHVMVDDQTLL